jgi:hypothetical protein
MVCHGELARMKPPARYLTSFYLMVSLGGALGGLFVGWLAPYVFRGYYELPVGLVACALLGLIVYRDFSNTAYAGWTLLSVALVVSLAVRTRDTSDEARWMGRNFYGGLRVAQDPDPDASEFASRWLAHGNVTHGLQFLSARLRDEPTTYYGRKSGVGLAIEHARHSAERVGVIGLGVGTLAAYGRPGDYYRFYEINPLVPQVARTQFSFLSDSPARTEVVLGDARLSLEREPDQRFDVLAVDAFSGDAIPVHLLTEEAFRLYFRHLAPEGVLAVHISNSHLDLAPVVCRLSESLHKHCVLIDSEQDEGLEIYSATWVLVTNRPEFFEIPSIKAAASAISSRPGLRLWTDDYSNLFQILK